MGLNLNAGLVSDVWYSPPNITEGDVVKIYGGIYNSSSNKITGTADYYIDGANVVHLPFSSEPKSLTQIEDHWIATTGDHHVQIKVATSSAPLAKIESDEAVISVAKKVTVESVKKDTENILTSINHKINPIAENLAAQVEKVGSSTIARPATQTGAYLVRHWGWTLLVLLAVYLIFFRKKKKRESWW